VVVVILLAALVGPLLAVVLGVLSVIPVRSVREPAEGPQEAVVIAVPGTVTGVPDVTPGTAPTIAPQPAPAATSRARRDFLDPDNTLAWAIVLPSLAGLFLLAGAAAAALMGTIWKRASLRSVGVTQGDHSGWARTRLVLFVLLSWVALCAYLVLDLLFAISLSYRFVALYGAFWVLVGALLLYDRTLYSKLVVLALLVLVLWSVRFVNWYIRETGGGPPGSESQYQYDQQGEIVSGWVTYRHTDKGWGDSDLGVVTVREGRVTEAEFLPD